MQLWGTGLLAAVSFEPGPERSCSSSGRLIFVQNPDSPCQIMSNFEIDSATAQLKFTPNGMDVTEATFQVCSQEVRIFELPFW